MAKQTQRDMFADVLRVVAAFSVVFQHTTSSVWYWETVTTWQWIGLNFLNSLVRFGVGVFVMISGAYMLDPTKNETPQKILHKKFPRMITLIVFWVLLYGIIQTIIDGGSWQDYLSTPLLIFTKPAPHLWFLYMIAGLYLCTPFLRVYTANASKKMQAYTIGLLFTFGLLLPTVEFILRRFYNVYMYKNLILQGCTSFLVFYLAGFYVVKFGLERRWRLTLYASALASWAASFWLTTVVSFNKQMPSEYFFGNFRPTTFLMAFAVFVFIHNRYRNRETTSPMLSKASACTLGIYLLHPLFIKAIYGMEKLLPEDNRLWNVFSVPFFAIAIFFASYTTILLFRKLPWISKFL